MRRPLAACRPLNWFSLRKKRFDRSGFCCCKARKTVAAVAGAPPFWQGKPQPDRLACPRMKVPGKFTCHMLDFLIVPESPTPKSFTASACNIKLPNLACYTCRCFLSLLVGRRIVQPRLPGAGDTLSTTQQRQPRHFLLNEPIRSPQGSSRQ